MAESKRRGRFAKDSDDGGQSIFDLFEPPPEQEASSFGRIPIIRDENDEDSLDLTNVEYVEAQAAAEAEAAGLRHWTEPATGQVPAALAADVQDRTGEVQGPSWRGEEPDWAGPDLSDVFADTEAISHERTTPPRARRGVEPGGDELVIEPEPQLPPPPVAPSTGEPGRGARSDQGPSIFDDATPMEAGRRRGSGAVPAPSGRGAIPPPAHGDRIDRASERSDRVSARAERAVDRAAERIADRAASAERTAERTAGRADRLGERVERAGDRAAARTERAAARTASRVQSGVGRVDRAAADPHPQGEMSPPPPPTGPAAERQSALAPAVERQPRPGGLGGAGDIPANGSRSNRPPSIGAEAAALTPTEAGRPAPGSVPDPTTPLAARGRRGRDRQVDVSAEAPESTPFLDPDAALEAAQARRAHAQQAGLAGGGGPSDVRIEMEAAERGDGLLHHGMDPADPNEEYDPEYEEYAAFDDEPRGRSFGQRIAVGIGLAALVAVALGAGALPTLLLVGLLCLFGVLELFNAMRTAGLRPAILLGLVGAVALPAATYVRGEAGYPLVIGLAVVFGMLWYLTGADTERPVLNLGLTFTGILWVGGLAGFAALMLRADGGRSLLLATIIITAVSDTLAYLGGKAYGTKPFHSASPNKTWEGTLTGFFGALFAGLAMGVTDVISLFNDDFLAMMVLAAVVGVLAPIGDLAESLVKRDLGIKDMGTLLPGHGGVLDRVDGLLFALPGAYYLAIVFQLI